MNVIHTAARRTLVLCVATGLCIQTYRRCAHAGEDAIETEFPHVIQPEFGASEFAPGDQIVIISVRGDRKHLEPGGRYVVEGTYTLGSAEGADVAWFSTSRGPSSSTPVSKDEQVKISQGSGHFRLKKTLLNDGWLHVTFYVDNHSHGGIYFGEKGFEKTVLRQKGWSDFSKDSPRQNPDRRSESGENGELSGAVNAAIMAYLGNPVAAPADLDVKYTPTNLAAAFTALAKSAGWRIQRLAVDDAEFPFLVYGVLAGKHEFGEKDLRQMKGYDYGGCVRGNREDGATYFSLNMIPHNQYPSGQAAACHRRLMVRLQMLADSARQPK